MYGLHRGVSFPYLPPDELDRRRPPWAGHPRTQPRILVRPERTTRSNPAKSVRGSPGPTVFAGFYWGRPEDKRHGPTGSHPLLQSEPRLARKSAIPVTCPNGDEDGFFLLRGAPRHQIKSFRFRISPTELEMRCFSIPAQAAWRCGIGIRTKSWQRSNPSSPRDATARRPNASAHCGEKLPQIMVFRRRLTF